jgi:transcriptional regulator with XRE-family HTH domain
MSCCILAWVIIMQLKIRDLREDRDLTQKQLAAVLVCDQSLYSKYERGERPLPLELADKLADCLEIPAVNQTKADCRILCVLHRKTCVSLPFHTILHFDENRH